MGLLRWIIIIAGIVLMWMFSLKAAEAGFTETGGLTAEALKNILLIPVTYLSVRLLFKLNK